MTKPRSLASYANENTIPGSHIQTGTVDTDQLSDGAVTQAKIDPGVSFPIADGSIDNAKISPTAAIEATKLSFLTEDSVTTRTVQSKLEDSVNVRDYGAVGDGVADDTAALNAALAAAVHVFVPANTILKITSTITIPNNRTLEGSDRVSSEIRISGNISGLNVKRYTTLKNLRIRGSSAMGTDKYHVGLGTAGDSARSNIVNCFIGGNTVEAGDPSFSLDGGVAIKGGITFLNNIVDCYIVAARAGIELSGVVNAIRIAGTECQACSTHGASIFQANGVVLSQCTFENNFKQGLVIGDSRACVLNGCYFEFNNRSPHGDIRADLLIDGPSPGVSLTMQGLFFLKGPGNTEYGLYLDRQRGVSLDGAFFNSYQSATNYLYAANTGGNSFGVLQNVFASGVGASRSITGNWQLYGFEHSGLVERAKHTFTGILEVPTVQLEGSVTWKSGNGSPEGVVTAPVGSLYSRRDGGAGSALYVKENGTGNTGWVAK